MASNTVPVGLPPVPPNIGAIVGAQFVGTLLNFCLYGVLAVQAYIYYITFPKDSWKIKGLVYFVVALETAQTITTGIDGFRWFANGFGNVLVIAAPGLGPLNTPIMGSIIALIVQSFFCYRIWVIKKSAWWLSALILAVSVISAVGGIIGGIEAWIQEDISEDHNNNTVVNMWLIADVVADVMIAASMSFLLLRASNRRIHQTHRMITRIIQMTVETNAISTFLAILTLILFSVDPGATFFICPSMLLGKTYSNSLLLSFNNRAYISKNEHQITLPVSSSLFTNSVQPSSGTTLNSNTYANNNTYAMGTLKQTSLGVKVDQESFEV